MNSLNSTTSTQTTTPPNQTAGPHPTTSTTSISSPLLATPSIIGVLIGVLIFVAFCVFLGYLWRRRQNHDKEPYHEDIQQEQPLGVHVASIPKSDVPNPWYEQPKDDEAMVRLFREVDGRLTDHVLNFYVVSDVETYHEDVSTPPKETRRELESKVSALERLLPLQESRAFVLRAIISERIMRSASEQTQAPVTKAPKRSSLSVFRRGIETVAGSSHDERLFHENDFRERWVLKLAQTACDETKAFAVTDPKSDVRLRSMENVVRTAVEFVITMAKQPTKFELVWPLRNAGESLSKVPYDPQVMEATDVRRDRRSGSGRVRAVVFPGLRKSQQEESLLSKIQVLVY